ncbi:MAG: hypothetical protein V5B40_06520 [Candidatus Accumulibacter meliphilus]|uniref:hypothetical protein n=1 Tax=Candidatus Accumulibacter meliphilus TaxID=2211374 RepID=UPI002FC369FA
MANIDFANVHLGILDNSHRLSPKTRLFVLFGNRNYNAFGLPVTGLSKKNEDYFRCRIDDQFWHEDLYLFVLRSPNFDDFTTNHPVAINSSSLGNPPKPLLLLG